MTQAIKKLLQSETFNRFTITFSQNTAPGWKLSTALAAAGVTVKTRIKIFILPGVFVGGMTIDSAPVGSRIKLINNGSIIGASGSGTGLVVRTMTRIINNGLIAGGGGNGGKGGDGQHGGLNSGNMCETMTLAGGAGGRGAGMVGTTLVLASNGSAGVVASDSGARGGNGGNGASYGQPGTTGAPGYRGNSWPGGTKTNPDGTSQYYPACGAYNSGVYQTGASGGAAGVAVDGQSLIVFEARGDISGPVI